MLASDSFGGKWKEKQNAPDRVGKDFSKPIPLPPQGKHVSWSWGVSFLSTILYLTRCMCMHKQYTESIQNIQNKRQHYHTYSTTCFIYSTLCFPTPSIVIQVDLDLHFNWFRIPLYEIYYSLFIHLFKFEYSGCF